MKKPFKKFDFIQKTKNIKFIHKIKSYEGLYVELNLYKSIETFLFNDLLIYNEPPDFNKFENGEIYYGFL